VLEYFVIGHIAAAILTTIIVFRLDYFERPQAIGQSLVVWLIPFLGAVLVLVFQSVVHRNMTTKSNPNSENHYNDEGAAEDLYQVLESDD
jgi:predicted CDP-diglyceride synthetase/phosphatidate cytidylyltransferase